MFNKHHEDSLKNVTDKAYQAGEHVIGRFIRYLFHSFRFVIFIGIAILSAIVAFSFGALNYRNYIKADKRDKEAHKDGV
jgi:hypothetical protein